MEERNVVQRSPVRLAVMASLTPSIRLLMPLLKLPPSISGIDSNPKIIPTMVAASPRYNGTGTIWAISSSRLSTSRSTRSLIIPKLTAAPKLLRR